MTGIPPTASGLGALRAFSNANGARTLTLLRLATGERINSARDDPAGMIASENLSAALAALEAETRSLERSDHVASTADAALGEVSDLLARGEALAVQAANDGGLSDAEREALQVEMDSIVHAVDRIASSTTFNGERLLEGSVTLDAAGESFHLFSSYSGDLGETDVDGETMMLADVATGGAVTLDANPAGAQAVLRNAADEIATERARIGAFQQNTIAPSMAMLASSIENVSSARSMIRDTDYAAETAEAARTGVLTDASARMLVISSGEAARILDLLG